MDLWNFGIMEFWSPLSPTMRIKKKDTLLNGLLWQQISIKPNEILDHWKAL